MQYLEGVGKDSFYGFLAGLRGVRFRDEEFAHLYARNNGRPSVPRSLLATELLSQVLLQDIARKEEGTALVKGVAKDRMLSVHDPEMRHGRKSASTGTRRSWRWIQMSSG